MSRPNTNNKELFESMPVAKAVRIMAVPAVVGQLIVLIYSIADTFFIGRTNNPYMVAGASLILPLFNISIPIAAILGVGGGALISQLLGAGREGEAKRVASFSMKASVALGLFFSLFTLVFMNSLLNLLGADADTYAFARQYAFCVIVFGSIPTVMTNVLSVLVRSIGDSGKAGFGITMGGIINIFLDPLFMFVLLPRGNEILGAGIATCLSNCITCTYFVVQIRRMRKTSVLGLVPLSDFPEKESLKRIFAVGVPSAVATFLFDIDFIVIDKLMSGYNAVALAAIGIVLKAERLPLNIGIGICQGMVPIIAYNFAQKNYKRMREVERFSMISGVVCAIISITLYQLFAPYIMRFFIDDTATVTLGTSFLRVRCLATILMFMSFYHVHVFNGYGRGKEALFLGVARWLAFNIPMLYILNAIFGIYGVVWAQLVGDILTVTLSLYVHRQFVKKVLPTL